MSDRNSIWLTERLNEDARFQLRATRELVRVRSRYQEIAVLETPDFGRVLQLDGANMTSERDEFFYHEAMTHPALIAQVAPKRALVIGGGDGGAAEEILKHSTMAEVVIAELDAEVVAISRQWLPSVHGGALDGHPRVRIEIGDGLAYLQTCQTQFDLIVMDLTDPDAHTEALYSTHFYALARDHLSATGCLTTHIGSPIFHAARFRGAFHALRDVFPFVAPALTYVPLYGALWGMAIASMRSDACAISSATMTKRLVDRNLQSLQFYDARTHTALFSLPRYVRNVLV